MLGSAHLSPLQLHSPSPNQPAAGDELPTAKGQGLIRRKNSLKMFSTLDRDQKTAEMAAEATAERKQKLEQHVIEAASPTRSDSGSTQSESEEHVLRHLTTSKTLPRHSDKGKCTNNMYRLFVDLLPTHQSSGC